MNSTMDCGNPEKILTGPADFVAGRPVDPERGSGCAGQGVTSYVEESSPVWEKRPDAALKRSSTRVIEREARREVLTEKQAPPNIVPRESTFVGFSALSERLEAVEAAEERQASMRTTATPSSLSNQAAFEGTADFDKRLEVFSDAADAWHSDNPLGTCGRLSPSDTITPIGSPLPAVITGTSPTHSGAEFSMQELVDYLMEQLPFPEGDAVAPQMMPEATPWQRVEQGGLLGESTLAVNEAVEVIDRILRSGLLNPNTTRAAVAAMADYHLGCIRDERENPLPEIPRVDGISFWRLPRSMQSFP